jgi:hypothetical protein
LIRELKKLKTNTATFYKDENDIIHVVLHEGVSLDYYDALDHYLVIKNLSGNAPVLKLIDGRCGWSIQSKARKFLAGKEVKEKTIARAIVQGSSIKKVLVNFFTELNKPEVPTRMFTDYDEAYAWLLEMKAKTK